MIIIAAYGLHDILTARPDLAEVSITAAVRDAVGSNA